FPVWPWRATDTGGSACPIESAPERKRPRSAWQPWAWLQRLRKRPRPSANVDVHAVNNNGGIVYAWFDAEVSMEPCSAREHTTCLRILTGPAPAETTSTTRE